MDNQSIKDDSYAKQDLAFFSSGLYKTICYMNCKHKGQDKIHGSGNRVFNIGTKACRCTVCVASKDKPKEA